MCGSQRLCWYRGDARFFIKRQEDVNNNETASDFRRCLGSRSGCADADAMSNRAFGRAADGQKSILESSRIGGGTPAAFAAPHLGEYESQPAPSFRCRLAIAVGMEATQRCSRWKLDSG